MASPSGGTSSGSIALQISDDSQQQPNTTDMRKRKRMLSNRESARRSRMRKQKHLDDLELQVINLRTGNNQILNQLSMVAESVARIESENSVLSARVSELIHRLQALNDIIHCMSCKESATPCFEDFGNYDDDADSSGLWSLICADQLIIETGDGLFM